MPAFNKCNWKLYIVKLAVVCLMAAAYSLLSPALWTNKSANKVEYVAATPFNLSEPQNKTQSGTEKESLDEIKVTPELKPKMKYILQWGPRHSPFDMMGQEQSAFNENSCKYRNCFVTNQKNFFPDLTQFDAIVFGGNLMPNRNNLPSRRSEKQKYIFAATESAHNFRICDNIFDGYFNWTWTYKINSDARWSYISISDVKGRVIGPNRSMEWPQNMDPITDELKKSLSSKNKVAAWFVSHCNTYSHRERFVKELQNHLKERNYNWTVDVYGPCGTYKCPRSRHKECLETLKRDYYFYFSFENSFAEDYVTEKLLHALNNNAVPVVFGGADYSRYLPPGSYLDARKLGVVKLAETMDAIHKNLTAYHDFFRWHNHFRYENNMESDVCNLCALLNDEEAMAKTTVYQDFRRWWNDEQWDGTDAHCKVH